MFSALKNGFGWLTGQAYDYVEDDPMHRDLFNLPRTPDGAAENEEGSDTALSENGEYDDDGYSDMDGSRSEHESGNYQDQEGDIDEKGHEDNVQEQEGNDEEQDQGDEEQGQDGHGSDHEARSKEQDQEANGNCTLNHHPRTFEEDNVLGSSDDEFVSADQCTTPSCAKAGHTKSQNVPLGRNNALKSMTIEKMLEIANKTFDEIESDMKKGGVSTVGGILGGHRTPESNKSGDKRLNGLHDYLTTGAAKRIRTEEIGANADAKMLPGDVMAVTSNGPTTIAAQGQTGDSANNNNEDARGNMNLIDFGDVFKGIEDLWVRLYNYERRPPKGKGAKRGRTSKHVKMISLKEALKELSSDINIKNYDSDVFKGMQKQFDDLCTTLCRLYLRSSYYTEMVDGAPKHNDHRVAKFEDMHTGVANKRKFIAPIALYIAAVTLVETNVGIIRGFRTSEEHLLKYNSYARQICGNPDAIFK